MGVGTAGTLWVQGCSSQTLSGILNQGLHFLKSIVLHTSASLSLNENWDPHVRDDMEMMLNKIVPEGLPYKHCSEGPDDMPAHVKACFLGSSLTIPVTDGRLNVGTWQGVWLCEHRNEAGSRKLVVTVNGCVREVDGRTPSSPLSPLASTSSS